MLRFRILPGALAEMSARINAAHQAAAVVVSGSADHLVVEAEGVAWEVVAGVVAAAVMASHVGAVAARDAAVELAVASGESAFASVELAEEGVGVGAGRRLVVHLRGGGGAGQATIDDR